MRGLAVILSFLVFVAGCGSREEPTPNAGSPGGAGPAVVSAAVLDVQSAQVPIQIEVTGQVTAVTQAMLSSKVQGLVQEMRVREGERVSKGQALVVLDSRDLRAGLARAEAEAENTRAHLARMERLFAEESVAKQELENAQRSFKVAEAVREAAQVQLSYTLVKAPFDGLITEKKIEIGELASPGQPLLKMEDPRRLRLEATVAEGDLKAIARGDRIPILVDALGSHLQGTVSQILPTGDPETHTFLVKVDLPAATGLKAGMFGRMRFNKGLGRTLVVPNRAVVERGELTGVYVVGADNVARLRWIKIGRRVPAEAAAGGLSSGRRTEDNVEVLSGLNAGERIVAEARQGMDGVRVQATGTTAAPVPP